MAITKYHRTGDTLRDCRIIRFDKPDHLSVFKISTILPFLISDSVKFYCLLLPITWYSLCETVISNLFYVVHHAIQQPLDIDFYLAP
jgi:hypothetical protein